ncbi:hypothetical protein AQUCO_02300196v1 [Aquilegia coerulea]|uniref:Uncharacterized protein n=1 Tax=Aquilegia coerulea TaxID=218851 RepID=A0A2G5DCH9_AQUCA|nr:hypothetical protein AQUCO_02300196v1 [Aquilegia coerulea]
MGSSEEVVAVEEAVLAMGPDQVLGMAQVVEAVLAMVWDQVLDMAQGLAQVMARVVEAVATGSGSGYGSGSGGSGSGYGSGQGSGYGGGGGGGGSSGDGSGHGSGYGSGSGGGGGGGYGMPPYGPGYGGGWVPAGLCEFCNKGGFVYGFQGGPSSCYVMSGGPHPTPTHPPAGQTEPINEMKSDPKSTLTVNPTPNSPPAGNTEPINNIKEKIKPDHDGGKPKPRSSQSVHPTSDHPSPFTPPISQSLTPPTAPDLHPILGN